MSKRKLLTLALAVCMVAILAVGGTLAYFTDTDTAENVFTVGGVDIALHEDNKEGDIDDDYKEWLGDQVLLPGDNQTNTIAKVVTVENTGKSPAYVRLHIAIPEALDDGRDTFNASLNLLHFNAYDTSYVTGKWNWGKKLTAGRTSFVGAGDTWNSYQTTIHNGTTNKDILYNVYVVTYETALPAGETTVSAMHQVYIYNTVTNEQIAQANAVLGEGGWNILIKAEACQIGALSSGAADDAFTNLNTTFGTPSDSANPWNNYGK